VPLILARPAICGEGNSTTTLSGEVGLQLKQDK
jgi:hypothetical protein